MRAACVIVLLLAVLAAAGCGGGGDEEFPTEATAEGPIGSGPEGVWIFRPAGEPKNVVIYFHGQGGSAEATPTNHRAWIDHLVERGSVVVYPRYEMELERNPMQFALAGIRTAAERYDLAGLPVLAIGYSRGGALAVEYGATAAGEDDVPVPDAIMSVFPGSVGNFDRRIDLAPLADDTIVLLMFGDRDNIVRDVGFRMLLDRLEASGFPAEQVLYQYVRSRGDFVADHVAPLRSTPGARTAFWQPADKLLEGLEEELE